MSFIKLSILVAISMLSTVAIGATVCSTNCLALEFQIPTLNESSGQSIPVNSGSVIGQYSMINNVHSDGDLYLDYSIFSASQDLNIGSGFTLHGSSVTIFSFFNTPIVSPIPQLGSVVGDPTIIELTGNWALFSLNPQLGGLFSTSGNIYVGNYSYLSPVPIPASIYLLLSALIFPALKLRFRHS